jgi:TRAP-type mannitol/chloroaromatic compound transport system permease small subunit
MQRRENGMGNDFYKGLGAVFMIAGGFFYTLERVASRIANAMIVAGAAVRGPSSNSIFETPNYMVWFFLFIGFVLLVFGFPSKAK